MITKDEIQGALIAAACIVLIFSGVALAQYDREAAIWERFSKQHDENGDGQVSAEEFGRSHSRFRMLDDNGDGTVTADELQLTLERFGPPPPPGRGLAHVADEDSDGRVTREEWDTEVSLMDADGDGIVSEEEMAATLQRHRPGAKPGIGPGPGYGPMSGHLDANGNEMLDVGDFDLMFDTFDADSDGVISTEEMPERWGHRGVRPGRAHRRGPEAGFGPRGEFGGAAGPGQRHLLRADEDGDGAVTLDEWNTMLDEFDRQAIFDALDADGDQVISPEEMAAARPRRGASPSLE